MPLLIVSVLLFVGFGFRMFSERPLNDGLMVGLPTLPAVGQLRRLDRVMAYDRALYDTVADLARRNPVDTFADADQTNQMVATILFRWADALEQEQTPAVQLDPRVYHFLRRTRYLEELSAPLDADTFEDINIGWRNLFSHFRSLLLAQSDAGKAVYDGRVSYDIRSNRLRVEGPLSADFLQQLAVRIAASDNPGAAINMITDYIDDTRGLSNLSDEEQDLLDIFFTVASGRPAP